MGKLEDTEFRNPFSIPNAPERVATPVPPKKRRVTRTQKLDTDLIEYCFRNKHLKHLWVYSIIRWHGENNGGFAWRDKLEFPGIQKRQLQRYIKDLEQWGWISRSDKSFRNFSIKRITKNLRLQRRTCIEIEETHLLDFSKFKAYIFAGRINQSIKSQAKRAKKMKQQYESGTVDNSDSATYPEILYKPHQLSLSLIAMFLGISKTQAHNLKKLAREKSYLKFYAEYEKFLSAKDVGSETRKQHHIRKEILPNGKTALVIRGADVIYSHVPLTRRYKMKIKPIVNTTNKRLLCAEFCENSINEMEYNKELRKNDVIYSYLTNCNSIDIINNELRNYTVTGMAKNASPLSYSSNFDAGDEWPF